jgi:DNA gyrase subunit A
MKRINYLRELLGDPHKIDGVIRSELTEIREKYGDPRRTQIGADAEDIDVEDLIAEESIVVTMTNQGYIKRLPADTYRAQRRGGRGITGATTKEEDFVENLFITTTHTHILFFTNKGKVYKLRGHQIPEASRQARGTAIVNLLQIDRGEQVNAVIPVKEFGSGQYLFMATKLGTVKKTPLSEFENIRVGGLIALGLGDGDELVCVRLTDGKQQILMVTRRGLAIRFSEEDVRSMGRTAHGVRGVTLQGDDDRVVGADVVRPNADVLVVTESGYGKRTPIEEYREQTRGGKGVKTMHMTERNGEIVGVRMVRADYDIMLTTAAGIIIRVPVESISTMGRDTQGVRIIRLDEGDRLVAMAQLASREEE